MLLKIFMVISAIIALILAFSKRKSAPYPFLITLGMALCVFWACTAPEQHITIGFIAYLFFVGGALAYGLSSKGITPGKRLVITLMSAFIMLYWLWALNHYPGFAEIFPMLTLLVAAIGFLKKVRPGNEAGILFILLADAVAILAEHFLF